MPDLKQAYAILGLKENAPEEDVERRYEVLMRRQRGRSADSDREASEPTMAEITEAYKLIKGAAIEEIIKQQEPESETARRASHIWEYYRWHILGGIAAVLLLVYVFTSVMDSRKEENRIAQADVKITFFTNFQVEHADPLEVKLLESMTDWKDVHLVYQYVPHEAQDQFDAAMLQKALVSLAADTTDLYIIDKTNFEKFGKQGAFLSLQNFPALAIIPKERRLLLQVEDQGEAWTGIDVSNNAVLKSLNLPHEDLVAVIGVKSDKKDNAAKALEWLASH